MSLYWGGRTEDDLYLRDVAHAWARSHDNFRFIPVLSRSGAQADTPRRARVHEAVLDDFASLAARVIFAMGRHGLFHESTADAHSTNETPHVAVTLMAVIAFIVPAILFVAHNVPPDIFNRVGTLAAFGFLVPYFLITIAAPVFLSRLGQLRRRDVGYCVAAA
jgi:hypothetical protein